MNDLGAVLAKNANEYVPSTRPVTTLMMCWPGMNWFGVRANRYARNEPVSFTTAE
jgi:hypothetical protein